MTKAQAHWNQTRIRMVRQTWPDLFKIWPKPLVAQLIDDLATSRAKPSWALPRGHVVGHTVHVRETCHFCYLVNAWEFNQFLFFRWQRFYSSKFGFIDHPFIRAVNRAGSGSGLIERLNLMVSNQVDLLESWLSTNSIQVLENIFWSFFLL